MKATELRIGNYINNGNHIVIIGPAFFTSFDNYDFEKDGIFKPEINPIPLTEEWLLKFGFKWNKRLKMFEKGGWAYFLSTRKVLDNETTRYFVTDFMKKYKISKDFFYVHQLQNLYFALTGNELEIK